MNVASSVQCGEQKVALSGLGKNTYEKGDKKIDTLFDIHFKGVSTRFGLQTIEKYIENLDFIFCQSFQNLRLGSIKLLTANILA
jgi:hypothetical protein